MLTNVIEDGYDGFGRKRIHWRGKDFIELKDGDLVIPTMRVAPTGFAVSASAVQNVWDIFVLPEQLAKTPQSIEMRVLMAILRSVHKGLEDRR